VVAGPTSAADSHNLGHPRPVTQVTRYHRMARFLSILLTFYRLAWRGAESGAPEATRCPAPSVHVWNEA
jgi:hypothetical protein